MVFQTNDPFFPANAQFTRFFNKPGTIVADKTHFIPLLEEQAFQYMFLRPRRWGKSTFLNMLAAYYDVATKDSFEQLFGQLFIGKAPTKSRNSHLVLLFDFSTIVSTGSFDDIRSSFFNNVAQSLCQFLFKYQDILGSAPPEEYIVVNDIAVSLGNVLNLVQSSGYSAFVGVDEYDSPANTCLVDALENRKSLSAGQETIRCLANLLKHGFFATIKIHCGLSVEKYWITGVLPAFRDGISPLTAMQIISFDPRYQSLCGFTQDDVNAIVMRALPEDKRASTLDYLKLWYNGYVFSHGSKSPTMYNPQQVFTYLGHIISGLEPLTRTGEANAVHTGKILSLVGKTGAVTIYDLVSMLSTKVANANVVPEFSFLELMQAQEERSSSVTWSLLYYLGVVTYCEDSKFQEGSHTLRVPNYDMDETIRDRITNYLKGDPGFLTRMRASYTDFIRGDTTPFVCLLQDFFFQRPIRSHIDTAESSLEIAIEFLWVEQRQCATQVHLVVDSTKIQGAGLNGFIDMLVGNSLRKCDAPNPILVMELKNISLLGLWKAKQAYPTANPRSQNQYKNLLNDLRKATEENLLDFSYSFYDKDSRQWVTKQVREVFQEAIVQLDKYTTLLSLGQGELPRAGRQGRNGIVHDKVSCLDGGQDVLWGFVIICVGGARVICRRVAVVQTQYTYIVKLKA
ncbi:putative AAA-ATPase domain containing protein [Elaphomyces granulatus]